MSKSIFAFSLLLLLEHSLFSQCSLNKNSWKLVFNEEFDGSLANIETKWHIYHLQASGIDNNSIDLKENFSVSGGFGRFATKKLATPIWSSQYNKFVQYSSANIISKHDDYPYCNNNPGYLYGMFEMRCKFPKSDGIPIAYWFTGANSWPPEIDAFEWHSGAENKFFSTVHWYTNPGKDHCGNTYWLPFSLADDFHTWTVVWTPTKITWFLDNKEIKTDNIEIHIPGTHQVDMYARCQWRKMFQQTGTGTHWPPDPNVTVFDDYIVDYIKVYKPIGDTPYTPPSGYNPANPSAAHRAHMDNWHDNIVKPLYNNTPYKTDQNWVLNKIISVDTFNVFSDLNVIEGGNKFYYKGDFDLLWNTYWYNWGNGSQMYAAPMNWTNTISGDISVATTNQIPFFRKDQQLQYYQNSTFYSINGSNNVLSKIITNPNGLQVFYIGTDNKIHERRRTSLTTNLWTLHPVSVSQNVTEFMSLGNDFNTVYYRNTSSQLVRLWRNATTTAFTPTVLSKTTSSNVHSSLSISPSGDRIYYKTSSNNLNYFELINGNTWAHFVFSAIPQGGNTNIPINNVGANISVAENPHQIYYIGTDGKIWVVWNSLPTQWHNNAIDGNYNASDLKIINPTTSAKALYFVGADKQIRRHIWTTCEQLNPPCNISEERSQYSLQNIEVGQINTSLEINIKANPAFNELFVRLPQSFVGTSRIEIFDLNGQVLMQTQSDSQEIAISIIALRSAMYIIKIQNSNGTAHKKFVKS
jgi:Glycosyl hydrolases family 16/Secretion system C-terminal sorting domain